MMVVSFSSCLSTARSSLRIANESGWFDYLKSKESIHVEKIRKLIKEFDLAEHLPKDRQTIINKLAEAKKLKKEAAKFSSPIVSNEVAALKIRILSSQYRYELKKTVQALDENYFQGLLKSAETWKANEKLIKNKSLTDGDKERLKEVSAYSKFVKHLLKSDNEQKAFFEWCIRSRNRAAPYVEFRGMADRLRDFNLSMRIGSFGGGDLQIKKEHGYKDLTLPFEGKHLSVLDDELIVEFKGNYKLNIRQILQVFQDRSFTVGDLEYFPKEGICNWNPKRLGWYNNESKTYELINLNDDLHNWWEQLKPMEVITKELASKRFEDFEGNKLLCDGVKWVVTLISRTDYHIPDAEGNHAYLQIAIPDSQGNYRLYDFGKFSDFFPTTMRQRLDFLAKPVKGTVNYPDENRFRLDRDEEAISFLLNPAEGLAKMNSIKKDLQNVRKDNFYFEVLNGNCILWACKKLKLSKEQIHKMCGLTIMEAYPRGALGKIWTILRYLPDSTRRALFKALFIMIGAKQFVVVVGKDGKPKIKCLMNNPPWSPGAIRPHPTVLINRKRQAIPHEG